MENEALQAAALRATERPSAPARAGVGRRRAREHGPPAGAVELAGRERVPDIVLHAFTDGRDTSPDSRRRLPRRGGVPGTARGWRPVTRPLLRHGPRQALGSHRARLGRDRHGRSGVPADICGEAAVRAAYERGETDEFIQPTLVGEEGRIRDGDARGLLQLPARPRAPAHRALGEDDFAEFDRGERPRVALTTLTSYQEDWDYPVAFPPARPAVTLAAVLAERGDRAAARGGDREVRARDLLLQRRRGGPVPRRGARARGLPARRGHLRREAGDVAPRAAAARSWTLGERRRTASASSTSRTPTWSGTPAISRRPCGRSRPWTAASARWWRRCTGAGGACIVTADHGNADHMLEPGRQPEHGPLDEPGAARGHRGRGRRARGRRAGRRGARRCWSCSGEEQPTEMTGRV